MYQEEWREKKVQGKIYEIVMGEKFLNFIFKKPTNVHV